ncbi:DUF4394 domain-containing protein [Roseovarius tolerans]|nr:DUF4394 domain-containing protein [Roseovarius tolerans]
MAGFYTARSRTIPPLPWPSFAPPFSVDGAPVDLAPMGGFDIVSAKEGENMGLAILQMDGAASAGLYEIDLETGAATMKADLGMGGITGFAASLGM